MLKNWRTRLVIALAVLATAAFDNNPALAGYAQYGHGMQTVLNGTSIANGALYLETNSTWVNSGAFTPPAGGNGMQKPYVLETAFSAPACDQVLEARLLMTVWGGTRDYTCGLAVNVNGASALSEMTMGSTTDANPTFNGVESCVYGSGYGVWLVSVPVPPAMLNTDGSTNAVSVTITDTTQEFDGRIQQVSLLAVYQDASLHNTFDYVVGEGSGDIYRDENLSYSPPKVESRTVDLGPTDTAGLTSAHLHALYTYGTDEQNDRLYFNGVPFGGNDVAAFDADASVLDYEPDLVSFDVTAELAATNSLLFTVSDVDGVPDAREYSLRPHLAVLEVTHAVPEPAAATALGIGLLALLRRRRNR
ncbi:MAG: DUF3344 domain-containing protein [Planctomycetes bacterium]|nr:DUF3344 domain-containing protein [Planctomycetota bacterium]